MPTNYLIRRCKIKRIPKKLKNWFIKILSKSKMKLKLTFILTNTSISTGVPQYLDGVFQLLPKSIKYVANYRSSFSVSLIWITSLCGASFIFSPSSFLFSSYFFISYLLLFSVLSLFYSSVAIVLLLLE